MSGGNTFFLQGTNSSQPQSLEDESKGSLVLLVKRVHFDSLSNCELIIGESRLVFTAACGFDPGQQNQIGV